MRELSPLFSPCHLWLPSAAHVFRDPNDESRVRAIFDWAAEGWQSFISDPEVPAIFQEGGIQGRPQAAELAREHDA